VSNIQAPPRSEVVREAELADRGRRLFEYLAAVQRLGVKPVRRVAQYGRDGSVHWFAEFPEHEAVRTSLRVSQLAPSDPLVLVGRIPPRQSPSVPAALQSWLKGETGDPDNEPDVLETIPAPADGVAEQLDGDLPDDARAQLRLEDDGEALEALDRWLPLWRDWAAAERRDRPVRKLYGALFEAATNVTARPEELELVLSVGCLTWQPSGHDAVERHVLTCPAAIVLDEESGWIEVTAQPALATLDLEDDMLDPALVPTGPIEEVRASARDLTSHPLDRAAVGELLRRVSNTLHADGVFRDDDSRTQPGAAPVITFAPALVLRRRSQRGLAQVFAAIAATIESSGEVPAGFVPLLDPDRPPDVSGAATEGAVVEVDGEVFLPLPLNAVQLQILQRVDSQAQTLVQGPPGTGKTHTAAALITHLLAQGKRVLVTAKTDRALKEVRDKLPERIKPLAVAVVGANQEDLADLQVAVREISNRSYLHEPERDDDAIAEAMSTIGALQRDKASLSQSLLDARAAETTTHVVEGRTGTLARLAEWYADASEAHAWIDDLVSVESTPDAVLADPSALRWLELLRDSSLTADEPAAAHLSVDLAEVLDPDAFAATLDVVADATDVAAAHAHAQSHPAFSRLKALEPGDRARVRELVNAGIGALNAVKASAGTWTEGALRDVVTGRGPVWRAREESVEALVNAAQDVLAQVGVTIVVELPEGERSQMIALAEHLLAFLDGGAEIKTSADGSVRFGLLTPRPVKAARPLLDLAQVNGRPPTTAQALRALIAHARASDLLDALDRAWPADVEIPDEDTLHERLTWHATELGILRRLCELDDLLTATGRDLADLGLPGPSWDTPGAGGDYLAAAISADAEHVLASASYPLERTRRALESVAAWGDAGQDVHAMLEAVRHGDRDAYAAAHARAQRLRSVRDEVAERDRLTCQVRAGAPRLAQAVLADPNADVWEDRLASLSSAWAWARTGAWLRARQSADTNELQARIAVIDSRIRDQVETLAATRAWTHALSPSRLNGTARADLTHYAQLVRRLGKGTGKYADIRRAEIRTAMARCRPSVPVWILPIYRIAEQLPISENMFDVVIVDEASQAGIEGTFLQYLAPRVVVIGDDKQVSPAAVGVDQQQLRDLAERHIPDEPYKSAWVDPKRSLFDEAVMRFGARLVLTEHRRCVPEIIEFSNRIAYLPDNIKLEPVRQYGSDRLEPIRVVHVRDGYESGTTSKINRPEADAIVEQVRKCLTDPRYDNRTLGVISLLGPTQARHIQAKLLEAVPPEEWKARDLRCGDAADFQGSERDVIFLSMVSAPQAEGRANALTQEMYIQRYNVAASRAKDQLWIFHTVRRDQLTNPSDLRHQLLEYGYAVQARTGSGEHGLGTVPEDERVPPFDSLFEQRVYNRIRAHGYTVVPQHPALGYRIDLVVIGARGRLAVECDGDAWHGPDRYAQDLARQRELERCDWQFFHIRESAYYADPAATMEELWRTLDELEIRPPGWVDETLADDGPADDVITDVVAEAEEDADTPPGLDHHDRDDDAHDEQPWTLDHAQSTGDALHEPEFGFTDSEALSTGTFEPQPGIPSVARPAPTSRSVRVRSTVARPAPSAPPSGEALRPYVAFDEPLHPALESPLSVIRDSVVKIVAVEGPVLGSRIHTAYVAAAGGSRVGKAIAHQLNSVISAATRRGLLVEDNPLSQAGVKPRTYRLPGQPSVILRELGPRGLDQVPPAELAHLLMLAVHNHGWDNDEVLFRDVLARLGRSRLTTAALNTLNAALNLARTTAGEAGGRTR